ncbi:MAG: T9SS type A sorting domain-containing protein, partial [Bacteroidota bacterium]
NVPTQMVQNPAGEIFVTNHSYASYSGPYSHTIAKIDGLGNKSVFVSGYSIPTGLEIDQQQNLYFTRNNFSYSVYKVLPDGNVSVFTTLPHMPNPITLYQKGSLLDIFTVSHWGSKGIYRIDASGTYTLFNDLGYTTCQITPDGQYLYACSGDILYRISTVTGIREIFVTTLTNYQIYLTCIGPDNKLYVAARSFTDPTKNSIYRINGINDFTEIISNIPINYEENDILFKPSGVNDYDLYVCEMAGDRTNPDFNRIIKFPTIFSGSASLISGPDTVQQGQNNLAYSVAAIPNATSYLWSYSGTGATINGNSNNITISFASNATSGILNVKGSNVCGEGPSSFDFPVTVLTGVLANQVLQNLTITPGQVKCYDATQTITVAGNGTPFIVQDGGSVSLIAGQNIRFLPGVKVNPGGYIHGYITTTSEYCFSAMKPEALVQTKQVTEERIETVNWSVKVFPNPTTGILNLALKTSDPGIPVQIRIYNLLGEMIYSKELIGKNTDEFSLADEHPGIYLLHVVQGGRSEVVKVIRQ